MYYTYAFPKPSYVIFMYYTYAFPKPSYVIFMYYTYAFPKPSYRTEMIKTCFNPVPCAFFCTGGCTVALCTVALCTVALCTVALCTVALCTVALCTVALCTVALIAQSIWHMHGLFNRALFGINYRTVNCTVYYAIITMHNNAVNNASYMRIACI